MDENLYLLWDGPGARLIASCFPGCHVFRFALLLLWVEAPIALVQERGSLWLGMQLREHCVAYPIPGNPSCNYNTGGWRCFAVCCGHRTERMLRGLVNEGRRISVRAAG